VIITSTDESFYSDDLLGFFANKQNSKEPNIERIENIMNKVALLPPESTEKAPIKLPTILLLINKHQK
jgi:hypothetical protein